MFELENHVRIFVSPHAAGSTLEYAAADLTRLLKRIGVSVEQVETTSSVCGIWIGAPSVLDVSAICCDGFALSINASGIGIAAPTEKGVLNGTYELAERIGFRFLDPTPNGELIPEKPAKLQECTEIKNPRFPHRGIFIMAQEGEVPMEDRVRFFARLKYNAICFHGNTQVSDDLCTLLGLRKEAGGHGFPNLLDRKEFANNPDYFRMFQPDDLGGKRQPDSNMCVTNPEVRNIAVTAFREKLRAQPNLYALHAWADDLPAGGWCWCPSCRSYSVADQNLLAMSLLSRAADQEKLQHRIPILAYHDTLFPGAQVPVLKRMYLLWAPRERCYAHALNDSSCPRNAIHWKALCEWMKKFKGIDDPHTFEYYLDQLLFNGLHPFTPDVIANDMKAYKEAGIESHMTLQCVPSDIMPDYNQQFFAKAHWDSEITTDSFLNWLTEDEAFRAFQKVRADVFQRSLAMCEHSMQIYMDFRYLPESNDEFSRRMAEVYRESSEKLADATKKLSKTLSNGPWRHFEEQNILQADFEAAELLSMYYQQSAMCKFAEAQANNSEKAALEGCEFLKKNQESIESAAEKCKRAGYADTSWHLKNRIPVERREAVNKYAKYSKFKTL